MQFADLYRRNLARQLIVVAIMFGIVFQLGSGPCGCIEHNAWTQMIVNDHHDQDEALQCHLANHELDSLAALNCHSPHEPCQGIPPSSYIASDVKLAFLGRMEPSLAQANFNITIQHRRAIRSRPPVTTSCLFGSRDGCRMQVLQI